MVGAHPAHVHRRQRPFAAATLAALGSLAACGGPGAPPARAHDAPPAVAAVRDGFGADSDSQVLDSALFANWDDFIDPEGLPVVYEWSIGTKPGAADVMAWAKVAGATHASVHGIQMPLGVLLHVNVRATDLAGNCSPVSASDGIVIGQLPPAIAPTPTAVPTSDHAAPTQAPNGHLAAVDRAGITWTFDKPAQCGRFVNGDWWVLGPVTIVAIAPPSARDGERIRHGSMLDPDPKSLVQGYDSAMFGDGSAARYDAARNVALGVSRQQPLQLQPGCSLVSTIRDAEKCRSRSRRSQSRSARNEERRCSVRDRCLEYQLLARHAGCCGSCSRELLYLSRSWLSD